MLPLQQQLCTEIVTRLRQNPHLTFYATVPYLEQRTVTTRPHMDAVVNYLRTQGIASNYALDMDRWSFRRAQLPPPYCVLVCGGRNAGPDEAEHVYVVLDALQAERPISKLVHGGASGIDTFAGQWARKRNIPTAVHKPDWNNITVPGAVVALNSRGKQYNKLAGFIRNQKMLDDEKPDVVIAFAGGPGTADMVLRAKTAGVKVVELVD